MWIPSFRGACICLVMVATVIGPAWPQETGDAPPVRLRPGDAVRIEVKADPSMGGQFGVSQGGDMLVPGLGILRVADRPFAEVRRELYRRYEAELLDPVLLITPMVRVAVMGEVRQPGVFPVEPTHTVGDVLATVGGLTPRADRGEIRLIRDGESIPISLDAGSPSLERRIRSGDRLVVGRWSWFRENLAIFVSAATSVAAAAVTTFIVK